MPSLSFVEKLFFHKATDKRKVVVLPEIAAIGTGIVYGISNLLKYAQLLAGFDSQLLSYLVVPILFLAGGVIMAYVTRMAIVLVYWAVAKMLGGPGGLKELFYVTGMSFAYFWPAAAIVNLAFYQLPLAAQYFLIGIAMICLGIGVQYLALNLGRTQNFRLFKSISAIIISTIFMFSVYYLLL